MPENEHITKHLVPEGQRLAAADRMFGLGYALHLEPRVFQLAKGLTRNYDGGYWAFNILSNNGFYMSPVSQAVYDIRSENGYAGSVSADTLGIIVCLYAYSDLSFGEGRLAQTCATHYHLLRAFALIHDDVDTILAAID